MQCGFSVADTSQVGNSFPDLVIGRQGITALVELKTKRYSTTRTGVTALKQLSDGQSDFAEGWRGSMVIVAYDTFDVIRGFDTIVKHTREKL